MTAAESEKLGVLIGTVDGQADRLEKIEKVLDRIDSKFDSLDVVERPEHDLLIARVKVLEDDSVATAALTTMRHWLIVTGIALVGVASGVLFNFLRATYSAMGS